MARIIYQDERVTEYADGTEEVSFSQDEWRVMERNPRYFGLVQKCGHALSHQWSTGECGACEALGEMLSDIDPSDEAAANEILALFPAAPKDKDF